MSLAEQRVWVIPLLMLSWAMRTVGFDLRHPRVGSAPVPWPLQPAGSVLVEKTQVQPRLPVLFFSGLTISVSDVPQMRLVDPCLEIGSVAPAAGKHDWRAGIRQRHPRPGALLSELMLRVDSEVRLRVKLRFC